jgi:uncharacterized protein (TIGR02246 family)
MVGEAVLQNNRRLAAAAARGDAREMASVYTEDARLLPPNTEPVDGREAIESFWRAGLEMGIRGVALATVRLEQSGDLAYEVGRYVLRIEETETSVTDVGKYVAVHRRQRDRPWRKSVEIFNWNAPCPGEREADVAARLPASPASAGPSASELRASRARIVEAADAARRRLERDLHDGAQQRLVLAVLTLKRAQARAQGTPAEQLIAEACSQLEQGLAELRELARGLHPNVLTERGLEAALGVLVDSSPIPVELRVTSERLAPAAEAAVYFTVAEALTNVVKHAGATRAGVDVGVDDGTLVAEISDDGVGGASLAAGSGLRGLVDRLDVLGGSLTLESPVGAGTIIRAYAPLRPHLQGDAAHPPAANEVSEGDAIA